MESFSDRIGGFRRGRERKNAAIDEPGREASREPRQYPDLRLPVP